MQSNNEHIGSPGHSADLAGQTSHEKPLKKMSPIFKLRTMAGNYCKLSDEHELFIRKESETKRRLHETKIELEKMKAAKQHM